MSVITDTLATVFTTVGVGATVAAFQQVENSQRRLDEAQTRAAAAPAGAAGAGAQQALAEAQISVQQLAERQFARTAAVAVGMFRQIVHAAEEAIEKYTEFGAHAMAIRDLTGATGDQAARLTTVFSAFGMNHLASIREINRMSRDTLTPQGQQALVKIGVDPHDSSTGIDLFNKIRHGFQHTTNGIDKAALMMDVFGVRGVHNMLPLLRLTDEYWDRLMNVTSVTGAHLEQIQQWQMSTALLGATWEQGVIFPIIGMLLPGLTQIIGRITTMVDAWARFNALTQGMAGLLVIIFGVSALIYAVVSAVTALSGVLAVQNSLLAIRAALSGNWMALAAAGIIVGGMAIGGAMNTFGNKPTQTQDRHTRAMESHTAALTKHANDWGNLLHGGIPKGLNEYDIQQLARQASLGTIG